jgi:hypothetical protein
MTMDPSKLWDVTMGAIGGAFTAALSLWLALTGRIARLETGANACLVHQGVQEEQHKANQARLERIEDGIMRLLERK